MATLADTFLDDLDDLGGSDDEDKASQHSEGNEEVDGMDVELDDIKKAEEELKVVQRRNIDDVAVLRKSDRFLRHMQKLGVSVREMINDAAAGGRTGPVEKDPEYQLIVQSNEIIAEIDDEAAQVHRFVVDMYTPKFPELESIVTGPADYIATVKLIKNEVDMTKLPLDTILPQTTVMVVSVTGSTTPGKPLSEADLKQALAGCDEFVALGEAKSTLLNFVESRMSVIAPNVCAIIGSRIAAQLMGRAGGLAALSIIPSCNIQVIGQEKRHLAGFSSTAAMPHTGIIYYSDVCQLAPPFLRMKALKVTAAKVTLAARCDLHGNDIEGTTGARFRSEIEAKIEKWQEPDKAKQKKSLPKPDDVVGKKRGGKRVRRRKELFAMTDVRKEQNKMSFASMADEYGDSAMGLDFGMLGKAGGRMRAPVQKETRQAVTKKLRVSNLSSGQTNGLSSSLVFTPIQGLELVNPNAVDREASVKAANAKWFDSTSGFMSAKPK